MWADLFLCNKEPLLFEIDSLIENLRAYRDAIAADDQTGLTELLKAGRERWEEIDGPKAK
ncbi:MAG: prephenate dehydrogenase/arogenate dehydrogenase family protein, partial [Clostridia bacterium]|nr:prephenate dehydrogenase/arogenate dehydrogenase family protein [Clostridia bacterium]